MRRTTGRSIRGQVMFEEALTASGLPYGDNMDA